MLLPWTFKLVWAPVIDTVTIRPMGGARPWILGAELHDGGLAVGILWLGNFEEHLGGSEGERTFSPEFVYMLGCMFFVHNCFASLQDVCTDALAVDVLPPDEQGRVNGLMWGSKLLGKAFGTIVMAAGDGGGRRISARLGDSCRRRRAVHSAHRHHDVPALDARTARRATVPLEQG